MRLHPIVYVCWQDWIFGLTFGFARHPDPWNDPARWNSVCLHLGPITVGVHRGFARVDGGKTS